MNDDCLFCKIVRGEIPAYKVYEDENLLVILDIFPLSIGECLLITKEHYNSIFDLNPALGTNIFEVTMNTAKRLQSTLDCKGINIIQNNGKASGQEIDHFHIHILPREYSDGISIQGKAKKPTEEELNTVLAKILSYKNKI